MSIRLSNARRLVLGAACLALLAAAPAACAGGSSDREYAPAGNVSQPPCFGDSSGACPSGNPLEDF